MLNTPLNFKSSGSKYSTDILKYFVKHSIASNYAGVLL